MESAKVEVEKLRYVIFTRVAKVMQLGEPPDETWWVNFDGSWESLCFGKTKPFEKGDIVKITFGVHYAQTTTYFTQILGKFRVAEVAPTLTGFKAKIQLGPAQMEVNNIPSHADIRSGDIITLYTEVPTNAQPSRTSK